MFGEYIEVDFCNYEEELKFEITPKSKIKAILSPLHYVIQGDYG